MQLEQILNDYQIKKDCRLNNRIVLAPLNIQSSLFDGSVSINDIVFHQQHASKVGMDIVGSAYVSPSGNTDYGSISVADDKKIPGLTQLAKAIHSSGSKAILQLVHAGRMTNGHITQGHPVVAPSAIKATHGNVDTPTELTTEQISDIIDDFAAATRRAIKAGFDGIELHGANTFLIQQFMSPLSNQRQDSFGGSLAKRMKFPIFLVNQVKAVAKQLAPKPFIIGYRMSPEEVEAGGLKIKDNLMLAMVLKEVGIDYLSLSLHQYNQLPLTSDKLQAFSMPDVFRKAVGQSLPLMASGAINSKASLEDVHADLMAVGSKLFVDPMWPEELATGKSHLGAPITGGVPYSNIWPK
ncbi:oxidoreductase [Lentilactobacillus kisonensis]|uniref:Oxidoreductase, FAD FMN-binding protein n=1 Tax=Lentilactobacillus kisonensis DSM 19906 = JCM 15041 TaxID=1423766 RepID=A0A0R1NP01_9LACO|nr:NADH:flavin oxidoreductase [Lentilactobacillus kisonensis]KRL22151.1 oxidoreductase, FAD FMN-binding protein [Lentilactobacillus kisonensis DSM 19906 = JCM 15041]